MYHRYFHLFNSSLLICITLYPEWQQSRQQYNQNDLPHPGFINLHASFLVLLLFLNALLRLVKIVSEIPDQNKKRTAMKRFVIMATNEYLTRDPLPVTPPVRSILAALFPLLVWTGKVLVLSASAVRWYAQTINTLVPACNEERWRHLERDLLWWTGF